ncbi:SMI1/KNR4 family protein [Agarilytica rhodophyticola]|uniref:SMI1/KNR4 family protein n=1 Tax=Agarilytica rhodophyticola TaxID=1737490 RepID=UPI000B342C9F|nr:SMI1/KNR4 family protein [Agarilytica rhodophyticola]
MEEILEELRELSEDVSVALELPTEDDLVLIEEEILISLPHALRVFLLEASDIIYGSIEPVTAADPRSHTHLPEVAAQAWSMGMPREYIPIAEYDGGYACIAEDGKVSFWSSNGMLENKWDDFWLWCRDVWMAR